MKEDKDVKKRRIKPGLKYDVGLLFPVLFLVGLGIVMVYSASSALSLKKFGSDLYFLKKQAIFSLVGFIALVICRHFPYRSYRPIAYPFILTAILFLVLVHVPKIGFSAGGSARWIKLGIFSFQPSEFARLSLIIYLAYSLSKKKEHMREFLIGFFPHVIILGVLCMLIIIQPDFGAVVILGIITWIMLFVGGARVFHLAATLLAFIPFGYHFMASAEYRMKRLMSFLDPWQYPSDEGYQIVHSLMAFGTGGIWGTGIGKGYQKLFYLPEPHTDFIFSVIGEELGLIGVICILGLYTLIFWRGIKISINTEDAFGSLLALGITSAIGLQVAINMGVALGLLPTKGLTLPFLSYGGTSLVFSMASIGILMNISSSNAEIKEAGHVMPPLKRRFAHDY